MLSLILPIAYILALLLGVVLVLLPGVPALAYMFIVSLGYAWLEHFGVLTKWELVALGTIMVISILVDWLSGAIVSRWSGTSFLGLVAGMISMVFGTIIFSPIGGIICLFAVTLLMEYYIGRSHKEALTSAAGGVLGTIAGIFLNIGIAIAFIIFAIFFVFN